MLTGQDIRELVRYTRIVDVEAHVTSLYEMRSEELAGRLGAIMGGALASLGTLAAAQWFDAQVGVDWWSISKAGAFLLLLSLMGAVGIRYQLARLRRDSTWAKDLAARLATTHPRPEETERGN
jgi:hypothetical protein